MKLQKERIMIGLKCGKTFYVYDQSLEYQFVEFELVEPYKGFKTIVINRDNVMYRMYENGQS